MFTLNNNDSVPLYKQLYNQIREHVLSGRLPAHAKLPSVRDLATELATSRNTVEGAYQELYAEGYIYSRQRSGYFVSLLEHDAAPRPLSPGSGPRVGLPDASPASRYDFHPAQLAPGSFPTAVWRTCYLECLRESSGDLTRYSDPQGNWGLRCNIRQYLERSRGVICEPDQIVICSGLQQALDMVAQMLKEGHSSLAVEDPGYHLPRSVFRNNGYRIVPVAVNGNGIVLDDLKAGDSSIIYVTPSHQLPMGCVMPVANRLKLIEWAGAGGSLIIEDDYDSELRYHGRPIPSLQGLRPDGRIIYLGTFSKILSPALRMSYLILPRPLLATYDRYFRDYFSTVPLLEQKTMARFMELGHWERHVRRMRIGYQKKHDAMIRAIEHHFGNAALIVGQGAGLHVVVQLLGTTSTEAEIISRAEEKGIRLFPFSTFSETGGPATVNLLLGFGGMDPGTIENGIRELSHLCF